jgi:hypothetical protein
MGCQPGVKSANLTTVMNTTRESDFTKSYDTIKLGIDAHAKWFYVAWQLDGDTPQPVQKMTFEALCLRLDRYVRGNRKAFSVVRVPTQEEERERVRSKYSDEGLTL